jgi:CMP-N-acetylneuraminic acid synthetase
VLKRKKKFKKYYYAKSKIYMRNKNYLSLNNSVSQPPRVYSYSERNSSYTGKTYHYFI